MEKTTIYLTTELKRAVKETAAASGRSEATIIREAIASAVRRGRPPRPKLPLFASDDPRLAEKVDEALVGFGQR